MDERWHVESKMRTSGNTAGTWDSVRAASPPSKAAQRDHLVISSCPPADCGCAGCSTTSVLRANGTRSRQEVCLLPLLHAPVAWLAGVFLEHS